MVFSVKMDVLHRRPSGSAIGLIGKMIVVVACLLVATQGALNKYFQEREVRWRQEVAQESERIRALHAKQAEQGQKARAARVAGGMRLLGDGVLEQIQSGMLWTARDSGADLLWKAAIKYCEELPLDGGGWQLPTVSELLSLYDGNASETISCGDASCKVSTLFELSRQFTWSNEDAGSGLAWYVSLERGTQFAESIRVPSYYRALCVRPP